jgi:hypothetical protein
VNLKDFHRRLLAVESEAGRRRHIRVTAPKHELDAAVRAASPEDIALAIAALDPRDIGTTSRRAALEAAGRADT